MRHSPLKIALASLLLPMIAMIIGSGRPHKSMTITTAYIRTSVGNAWITVFSGSVTTALTTRAAGSPVELKIHPGSYTMYADQTTFHPLYFR